MKTIIYLFTCSLLLLTYSLQGQDNALRFDGVNDYMVAPAKTGYDISTGTIEVMVRPDAFTAGACIIGVRGAGGTRYSFTMAQNSIGLWNGAYFFPKTYAFTAGTWYHLAFVCNGVSTKIYVNGTYIGEHDYAFSGLDGQTLVIGAVKESGTATQFFPGAIDEVRIWNTIRTPQQINENMNISLSGIQTGLVGLFTFNQGTALGSNAAFSTVPDQSSIGNTATLYNFALSGSTSNYITSLLNQSSGSGWAWLLTGNAGTVATTHFIGTTSNQPLIFKTNNIERLRVLENGNVGIGIDTPKVKLAVRGSIKAMKLIVTLTPWADYVFHKSYQLPSLSEVEQYIKENHHLRDVPTTAEVELNGVNVGENQAVLLRKLEELTLYLIDQNKRIAEQQILINALEKRLEKKSN
jgi:hypothetical protein